ncbi:MAG: VWA domain-containing protein [Planctomycetia bacterium]|nr:VWA domain-containing protein [Planctomycetia bacterium]
MCIRLIRRGGRFLGAMLAMTALTFGIASFDAAPAQSQGLLVNTSPDSQSRLPRNEAIASRRPSSSMPVDQYKIKELEVNVKLQDQAATVQVTQSFVNTGSRTMEVAFVFPLPHDAAIDRLTLLVDGKEMPGKLFDKEEARRRYEEIVRKNQDPALLEWLGGGMFQTSVFPVPAGAERKVMIRYTQLCRQEQGVTNFLFPLSTAKYSTHPVEKVSVNMTIESGEEIKSVYSPTHTLDLKREKHRAKISYTAKNEVPSSDFRLMFDVGRGKVSARVLSYRPNTKDDGFFLLLANPQIEDADTERAAKTVVFVVDRSGSMSGEKINQAKNALKFVLSRLRKGDLFNIIAYDDQVESFRPELQKFNEENHSKALGFVESIYSGGSTNIDGALTLALKQLKDSDRPNYMLFLTDGLPTAGETNESKIVANAQLHNEVRARIIAFGVGYDVNSRMLDKLVRANFGQSEYVRPNQDIEEQVARLFGKMESPVLTDVKFNFMRDTDSDEAVVNRTYPRQAFDLFAGEQLVIVGRYRKSGEAKVRVEGKVGKEAEKFSFPAELAAAGSDSSMSFIEKLWATRRIGEIIDELDLKGKNEELVKELVQLSTRHGILTPYTSFLADETTNLQAVTQNATTADRQLRVLESNASGESGVAQRAAKSAFQYAPTPGAAAAPSASGIAGGVVYRDAAKDVAVEVKSVRSIGDKAFYQRGAQWVDSTVTDEQKKNARRCEQFSREYFDLAAKYGTKLSQYLVYDEPMLVNLDGETYLIEPAMAK